MAKTLKGTIVSDKMNKTVVVKVEEFKKHSRYGRYYKSSKKYKAHNENSEFHVGENVLIKECRPISKDKYFTVVKKL